MTIGTLEIAGPFERHHQFKEQLFRETPESDLVVAISRLDVMRLSAFSAYDYSQQHDHPTPARIALNSVSLLQLDKVNRRARQQDFYPRYCDLRALEPTRIRPEYLASTKQPEAVTFVPEVARIIEQQASRSPGVLSSDADLASAYAVYVTFVFGTQLRSEAAGVLPVLG